MPQVYNKDDHDTLVRKIAGNMSRHNAGLYRILTGESRIHSAAGSNADIQLVSIASDAVILSILVETSSSITLDRARLVWQSLAAEGPLEIALPKGMASRARHFCRKINVKAKLIEY